MKTALVVKLLTFSFFLFSLILALSTLRSPVYAADACTPNSSNFSYSSVINDYNKCAIQQNVYDDKVFNMNQIFGTACSLNVLISGYSPCKPETSKVTANIGALSGLSNAVAMIYAAPPASGVTYMAEKIQNLNPNHDAYAATDQGIGFNALKPVERVWTAFRNISYIGFIIVFVITGFMIMFRRKISSQAVATIQDSLPRLVIALILVTFSYAIAGLMIDLMYVIINLTISILAQAGLIKVDVAQFVFTDNLFGIVTKGWPEFATKTSSVVSSVLQQLFSNVLGVGHCSINANPAELFGVKGCLADSIAWLLGIVATIIFGIALIFVMVRLFFTLLMTYVTIILLTVFAPFIFLLQALPGQSGGKAWFKQMAANIAVFPTVIAMILLAGIIAGVDKYGADQSLFKTTSNNNYFNPPLLGGFAQDNIGNLVGLGIMLMLPAAAKMIKETIGVKDAGPLGIGLGAAAAAAQAGAAPVSKGGKALYSPYGQALSYSRFEKARNTLAGRSGSPAKALAGAPGNPEPHG
ncbi:hypothetical protein HY024_01500 [Candidatus Curtissbacteria bacterium]|nr:hypothetical protein [Candidatus Curtissbacteria bacterium]